MGVADTAHVSGAPHGGGRDSAYIASLDARHAACNDVKAMEQPDLGGDRSATIPSPEPATPAPDDLRLALELADIGADLASETAGPQTCAELRRQISRLRERVQCPRLPRTPTMHFQIKNRP